MLNTVIKSAQDVLANAADYPECILFLAKEIMNQRLAHRESVLYLWKNHREVTREYRAIKITSAVSRIEQYREREKLLRERVSIGKDNRMSALAYNRFHKCIGQLNNYTHLSAYIKFKFTELLKFYLTEDYTDFNKCIVELNNTTLSTATDPERFMQSISPNAAIEVLLFKLLKYNQGNK